MKKAKLKVTTKTFYNKWLYKVSLSLTGATLFRNRPYQDLIDYCNSERPPGPAYLVTVKLWEHRQEVLPVANFLINLDIDSHAFRIERDIFDFYTSDHEIYQEFAKEFEKYIIHQFEPALGTEELLTSSSTIVVKKYPHNRYKHKVFLLPHKMAGDQEGKEKYVEWLKSQDKITCTPSIERWFKTTDWNWDRRYVLVEDEKTLLMLKLRNAEVVGKIQNYIISDK